MEKTKLIFYRLIYVIEFIISLFMASELVDILDKSMNIEQIIIVVLLFIAIVFLIIINLKNSDKKVEKIFLSFAIPIGILYLFLIIPTYVPDENFHANRAYEVSVGEMIIEYDEEGKTITEIPEDLMEAGIDGNINSYEKLTKKIEENSDYNEVKEVFNPSQSYFPILYIFSGIGFFIGKIFNLNFIVTMYLARLLNLIFGLIMGYWAIKIIPFGKLLLAVYMFTPMYFQQEASMSADSFLNSTIIFFVAYNFYLIFRQRDIDIKEKILYICLGILIALCKTIYLPIIFLSLLLYKNKNIDKKKLTKFIILMVLICAIIGVIWYIFSRGYVDEREYLIKNNINSSEQINWIIKHPLDFIFTLIKTLKSNANIYLEQFLGNPLGWLDIEINGLIIKGFLIILLLTPFLERNEVNLNITDKLWMILLFLGMSFLTALALFIGWTNIGGEYILGIQGRYFIPIAILVLQCLCTKDKFLEFNKANLTTLSFAVLLNLFTIYEVINYFKI